MTQENLSFKQETPASEPQGSEATKHEAQDASEELKTLKAKFDVVQKRVDDSQSYIKAQNERMEALLEELKKAKKVEEVLSAVSSGSDKTAEVQKVSKETSSFDPEELVRKAKQEVFQELKAEKVKEQQDANFKLVAQKLSEVFHGQDVDAKVREVAAENDMTFEEIIALAKDKPKAALKLLQADVKTTNPQSSFSGASINTQAMSRKGQSKEPEFDNRNHQKVQDWMKWKLSQIQSS